MKTIALHFGGPLQSWATKALVKTRVDTDRKPGDRAIRGMLAACYGISRGEMYPPEIQKAVIDVVILRSGSIVRDYQTIGSRPGEEEYLSKIGRILARGKTPLKVAVADNGGFNSVVRRTYLGDASFIVLISGDGEEETDRLYEALRSPVWSPYFGKKAFAPAFPFILGVVNSERARFEAEELLNRQLGRVEAPENVDILESVEEHTDGDS